MSLSEHEEQLEAAANTRDPPGAASLFDYRAAFIKENLRKFTKIYRKIRNILPTSKIVKIKEIVRFQTGCTRL